MREIATSRAAGDNSFYVVVHAYLFMTFLMGSGLIGIVPHVFLTLVKAVSMACICCAVAYCYVNRWYAPVFIAVFAALYAIFVQLRFVDVAGVSINLNAGYPLYSFGGIAVMYVALRDDPNRVVRLLYRYAVCYVVLLSLFSCVPFLRPLLLHSPFAASGHGGHGTRISIMFLYPFMVAALGADAALRGKIDGKTLALSLMALACIVVSDYRVGTATSLAVLGGYAVMRLFSLRMKTISKVFTGGTVLILAAMAALYILDLNPYLLIFHDASALARALGFYTIRGVMMLDPVYGMGVAPDGKAFNWTPDRESLRFYDSDYGIFGILVWGGLVAEVLYLVVIFMAYRFAGDARRIGIAPHYLGAMAMTGWFQMVYNISSPTNMFSGYKEYACLMVAAALLAFEKKRFVASPLPASDHATAIAGGKV